jgi:hypothetical protein
MAQFYEALFKNKGGVDGIAEMWWEVFAQCTPAQKVRLLTEIQVCVKDLYDRNVTRAAESDDPVLWNDEQLESYLNAASKVREKEEDGPEPEFNI